MSCGFPGDKQVKKFADARKRYRVCLQYIVIFLDFHSTKQGLPLVDSWSRGLD